MKKLCLLLSCVLLFNMLSACSPKKHNIQQPTDFYYCNAEIGYNDPTAVIEKESREAAHFNGSIEQMLMDYLTGPDSEELVSLVPSGTELISCDSNDGELYIVFSPEFAELSGVGLSVCCGCILMSVNAFADVQKVHISALNTQLDEKKEFVLDMDDIVLMDTVE